MVTPQALAAKLRAAFAVELAEQVLALNTEALACEATPGDPERVRALFRIAHTLKGAAAAAGVAHVSHFCHVIEDRLALARDGTRPLASPDVALLLETADVLSEVAERLKAGDEVPQGRLRALEQRAQAASAVSPMSPAATALPAEAPHATAAIPARSTAALETVRVAADKLDALLAASGALLASRSSFDDRRAESDDLHESLRRWTRQWRQPARVLRAELARHGDTGAAARALHALDEHLRETTRALARLRDGIAHDARILNQVVSETSYRVQQLRMRPFRDACTRLPRAVHDAAAATGREAHLLVSGGDIDLDRTVVESLADALLPIVRNAVDHGLEPPEERERRSKPREGTITVSCAIQGDRVIVTVSDDGRGVDEDAVRAVMARRGLPVPTTAEAVAESLLRQTVSTRSDVSEISGRGVGVDIATTAMSRIHGSIRMRWQAGAGTAFTLECPPTLASLDVIVAAVGDHQFAFPTSSVARVMRVMDAEIVSAGGRPALASPGGIIPLASLAALLGPPLAARPRPGARPIVVIGAADRCLGVTVDAIAGAHEVVMHPLDSRGNALHLVAGVTMLGSGRVAAVLNAPAILEAGLAPGSMSAIETPTDNRDPARKVARILVVDDSITTRTLELSVLEAAGYDVLGAVDGADGWRLLQEQSVDLVVSDVEMPRLDGFDLCRAIRNAPRVARLPVVLVTALDSPEYRSRGLEAGADAYLAKSTFEQTELLTIVRQLLGEDIEP